ncbi:MAG: hypothetical protein ABI333_11135 [bacterium]
MAAQKSPLVGYNHNLKYRGRVYHVQTEDSGLDNPHIFTHLFHDGTILNTLKQDYNDLLGDASWEEKLRGRMQEQHKDMMKGLVKGSFDDKIVGFFGDLEAAEAEEMPMATLPPPPQRDRSKPAQRAPADQPATPWSTQRPAAAPPPAAQPPVRQASSDVVVSMPMVIVGNQGHGITAQPAPPPGATQSITSQPRTQYAAPPQQPAASASVPQESKTVPDSIFGSELISEKSLDEVILAYLSEDMTDD